MLEWYAIREDFNKRKIVNYNVLSGWENEIKKARKNKKFNDYASLKEWLKREFMYYYWSKAEHEICVGGLFVKSTEELEKFGAGRLNLATHKGDVENGSVMIGQISGMFHEIKPVAEIIEGLVSGIAGVNEQIGSTLK